MLELFLYAVGIMYTPGPVTLLAFNAGLDADTRAPFGFFFGVGAAMLVLLLLFGYSGQRLIGEQLLPYISVIGSAYILYLAQKIIRSRPELRAEQPAGKPLSFNNGFILHIVNPKAWLATLPLVTLYYPANHISGSGILSVSLIIALLCVGSPAFYTWLGHHFARLVSNPLWQRGFNFLMGVMLIYSAGSILHEHVYPLLQAS
ncbi:LysE family translocator [Pseudomonas sp. NA-150]|uniref:LysE family translocator n=1 Tax=Pseudomonas sp. NA-150 TaxID=3367525 RepID=UPI0037C555AB